MARESMSSRVSAISLASLDSSEVKVFCMVEYETDKLSF